MDYQLKHAAECTPEEISAFKKIVIAAKEVKKYSFDKLISNNPLLMFTPNSTNIEGVGALKIPNKSYKNKIFKKAQSTLNPNEFHYELGWVVALKANKGIGKFITETLSKHNSNIYATTRTENEKMNAILKKAAFIQNGICYTSERNNYQVNLYVKTG